MASIPLLPLEKLLVGDSLLTFDGDEDLFETVAVLSLRKGTTFTADSSVASFSFSESSPPPDLETFWKYFWACVLVWTTVLVFTILATFFHSCNQNNILQCL